MELEFFGAAGEVTGSCHIVRINGQRILLDCGMIQGSPRDESRNSDPFPFAAREVDAVVLSHAHIDHSGRLPLLVKRGYRGRIHTQNASRELCRVLLLDAASIQEYEARRASGRHPKAEPVTPLYTRDDAQDCLTRVVGHRYHEWFDVADGVSARFHDAGHILGSAVVELLLTSGDTSRRLVFSGDLGQFDTPILNDPESIADTDLVVMESTYGGRRHRERSNTIIEIGEIIDRCARDSGNILIPAFAIGRSQEILYTFGKHYDEWGLGNWHIFLDSPMAIEASEIYWSFPHLYDEEATRLADNFSNMPNLPNLHLTVSAKESKVINRLQGRGIIIAGSGMCSGGRILHHLKHNLANPHCQVIITGYQARGSLGRRLVDGDSNVLIHGREIDVRAGIHTIGGLSAHGDEEDLARWYGGFKNIPPVYFVHGEHDAGIKLQDLLRRLYGTSASLTIPGLKLDLRELRLRAT